METEVAIQRSVVDKYGEQCEDVEQVELELLLENLTCFLRADLPERPQVVW